jgi:hypothetical protein
VSTATFMNGLLRGRPHKARAGTTAGPEPDAPNAWGSADQGSRAGPALDPLAGGLAAINNFLKAPGVGGSPWRK